MSEKIYKEEPNFRFGPDTKNPLYALVDHQNPPPLAPSLWPNIYFSLVKPLLQPQFSPSVQNSWITTQKITSIQFKIAKCCYLKTYVLLLSIKRAFPSTSITIDMHTAFYFFFFSLLLNKISLFINYSRHFFHEQDRHETNYTLIALFSDQKIENNFIN